MGKTYSNKDGKKGGNNGRSLGKSGRYDDPELEIDMALMAKNKKRKAVKNKQDGRSES